MAALLASCRGYFYNFCQNIIKGTSMTFNNNIDNDTDEFDNEKDSLQKSMAVKLDLNFNCLGDTSWKKNNNINYQRIKCESYLYKLTPKQKMKKLYFKLNNQDLFFYKNEQSKMHNIAVVFRIGSVCQCRRRNNYIFTIRR